MGTRWRRFDVTRRFVDEEGDLPAPTLHERTARAKAVEILADAVLRLLRGEVAASVECGSPSASALPNANDPEG